MKIYCIIIVLIFLSKQEVLSGVAQGGPVATSNLILNGKSITQLSTDRTFSVTNQTSIASTAVIKTQDSLILAALHDSDINIRMWGNSSFLSNTSAASTISNTDISNWNNAFNASYINGWGINKSVAGSVTTFFSDTVKMTTQSDLNEYIANTIALIPVNNNQLTNGNNYITPSSANNITNKSGNISQWTNDASYITGISGSDVTTALGFTPYNSTNPSGYSSINGTGFVKSSGPTLIYDNNVYYLASNPSGYTSNTGTVMSVQSGAGLTGTVTTSGIISMPNIGTSGTYGSATQTPVLTTDAQGRITGVINTTITQPVTLSPSGSAGGDLTGTYPNPVLSNTGVIPSAYGSGISVPIITVDEKGRLTSVTSTTVTPSFNNLSDKPTTLSGYGITDAYPLVGNPSSFLISSDLSGYLLSSTASSTYVSLSGSYSNPSWIISVPFSKITGYTSSSVISALGYTPTNPNGTSLQYVRGDGALTTLNTSIVAESGNLYFTNARASAAISLTTTGSGSATYNTTTGALNIPVGVSGTLTSVSVTSTDLSIIGSPAVGASGNITANLTTTGVSAGTYNGSLTVDNKGRLTNASNTSFNASPGRLLSTTGSDNTFTVNASKNARVTYVINIAVALTLLPPLTSSAVISLDYSTNSGSSWVTICRATQSYGVALTLTTASDYVLSGEIPANALVRIYRSATAGSTVTLPLTTQQEVTY